jgi:tRNA threonylcarbamoyladenosine biosynthesis protein TsaB
MRNEIPLILAVETSGRQGSVAIAAGESLLSEKQFSGPMRHSAEIFPAIDDLLKQFGKQPSQIEQVYISIGPGSFTGLRIAVTIAKSMALANNAKIVAVDTLDCIAANIATENTELFSHREHREKIIQDRPSSVINSQSSDLLAVILDAKRGQFFTAVYEKTQDARPGTQDLIWKKTLEDCLMTAEEFLARFADKPIVLIGEGLVYYKDGFKSQNLKILDENYWTPSATNVHKLGWQKALRDEFADPVSLVPNYIRGPDAKIKIKN